jgi:succinyl-CoA synthetase beta subunit
MKLHEYQGKQLFAANGIRIPRGITATSPEEAAAAYEALIRQGAATSISVKAQLHAGGRGKAGGVLTASSAAEAAAHAKTLLGKRLVTKQTGSEGLPVSVVLLEERSPSACELYLALTIDRFTAKPVVLASQRGGMDIEEVAASEPGAIHREPFEFGREPDAASIARIVSALGLSGAQAEAGRVIVRALLALLEQADLSLAEINPLAVTQDGRVLAIDAKVILDDNALFRHPDLAAWRDESQEHPLELKASRIGISYVGLDGNIGCLVNGAGLAMATNDIIKLAGGSPANFLDVGGGANVDQVTNAFSIILADTKVRAVLVNIFGGIMRCDWIAQGLLNATERLEVKVPIVVRLQGTNVEEGRRLLSEAKRLNLISVDELADAARKVVELAG